MQFREINKKDLHPGCLIMTSLKGEGTLLINIGMKILGLTTPHAVIYVVNGNAFHNTRKRGVNWIKVRIMPMFYTKLQYLEPVGDRLNSETIEKATKVVLKCKFNTKKMYAHWIDMILRVTRFANLFKGESCISSAALFYRECGLDCPRHLNPVILNKMIIKPKKTNWLKKILFKKITFSWKTA